MPEIGQTISHYRITVKLGQGGMGEVFLAHDTSLDRKVALKFLPDIFSGDPERLARFEREAKLLASLNHPNIATIYGLEQAEGKRFLAMELVEGETLAQRIEVGPLPLDETLDVGRQIAEGLEVAHEKGIIHRDLKPTNIKITLEDKVKILDFGLAKALAGEPSTPDATNSPTVTAAMTRAGVILGTAAYMSPEQAKGKSVDKRSDIWSFGCVLFECLSGRRAFEGETVTETMAAILTREPTWDYLPATTPRRVRELLRRCLQKDRRLRLRDIGDVHFELRTTETEDRIEKPPAYSPRPRWRNALPWLLAAVGFTIAALAIWSGRSGQNAAEVKEVSSRTSIILPPEAPLAPTGAMPLCVGQPSLALSPDGRHLVYVALMNGATELWRRDMLTGEFKPLSGTRGAHGPFFSPDSQWVAFFADEKLKKTSLVGGEPTILASTYSIDLGGVWGSDSYIYYQPNDWGSLLKVSANPGLGGGKTQTLFPQAEMVQGQCWPSELPGNQSLLANIKYYPSIAGILNKTGVADPRVLPINEGSSIRYLPTGHLVYASPGKIMAIRYDLIHEQLLGSPIVIMDGVRTELNGSAQFSISSDGTLVYASGIHAAQGAFVWVDRQGKKDYVQKLGTNIFGNYSLSPDGTQLAITKAGVDGMDIWIYEFSRGVPRRFTYGGYHYPDAWSRDGKSLVFASFKDLSVGWRSYWKPMDSDREPNALPDAIPGRPVGFLPTNNDLVTCTKDTMFFASTPEKLEDRSSEFKLKKSIPLPNTQGKYFWAFQRISPDGRWMTYTSIESGRWEVYVCSFPDLARKKQISTNGGEEPRWNPSNGREIVYRWGSQWFSVDLTLEPEVLPNPPKPLFSGAYINVAGYDWDISPDGKRFLLIENKQQDMPQTELVVITNFFKLLKEKLPTK
jgi:serine/threonine protein kinase